MLKVEFSEKEELTVNTKNNKAKVNLTKTLSIFTILHPFDSLSI